MWTYKKRTESNIDWNTVLTQMKSEYRRRGPGWVSILYTVSSPTYMVANCVDNLSLITLITYLISLSLVDIITQLQYHTKWCLFEMSKMRRAQTSILIMITWCYLVPGLNYHWTWILCSLFPARLMHSPSKTHSYLVI